ncbi:MAG TPA: hypothetical protein VIV66_12870, partial [Pyrinomonadaceae bacterium]
MRRTFPSLILVLLSSWALVAAQEVFTSDKVDYTIELSSPTWRVVTEPDAAHEHAEFVYGDRLDGYLQIRKEVVEVGTTPANIAQRDQDQK